MSQLRENERMRLLGLTADYLLQNGVIDLRLRTLGDAIGTSHRVLLYYFESKQELISAALDEAARRSTVRDPSVFGPTGTGPVEAELVRVWTRISAPTQLPLFRLLLQVVAVAIHDSSRYGGFLEGLDSGWALAYRDYLVGHGVPPDTADDFAAEIIALQRGLQLELAVGGSSSSANRSFTTAARGWATRIAADAH